MERSSEFPERLLIDYITTNAERLLEKPQYTAILMRQSYQLDAEYTLELRTSAQKGGFHGESEEDQQRYVYVSDVHQDPVLSFNLDSDSAEGTRQYFEPLDAIIAAAEQQQPALAFFVQSVAGAQNRLAADQEIPGALRHYLDIQYYHLMDNPGVVRQENVTIETGDKELRVERHIISGDDKHLTAADRGDPQLYVGAYDGDRGVVFQIQSDGSPETFTRYNDLLQEMASIADEESILRDEDGSILMVSSKDGDLEAARRAERAAFGWPDVRIEHLRTIEKALRELA